MTKKEAAFALFEEGKYASSPEVKALKLKAHTRQIITGTGSMVVWKLKERVWKLRRSKRKLKGKTG